MKKAGLIISILLLILSSCVPMKQFKSLEEQNLALINKNSDYKIAYDDLMVIKTELASRILVLEDAINRMERDYTNIQREKNLVEERYKRTDELYQNLMKAQNELATGSEQEASKILKDLQDTQRRLLEKEDQLMKLESSLMQKKANLESLQKEFEAQNIRLMEMETILNHKDSVMNGLKNKVAQALYSFNSDELSVEMKNGKVYVSMEEKLMFESGSYKVGSKGTDAIKKLGVVLGQNPDIQILIEGHTDNVPYRGNTDLLIDNWDLSAKRATSIVRILLKNSNIDPSRLTAAGRSKYIPVASNDSAEGKQKNRRTEIILTPNLDELFNLIGKGN